MLRIKTTISQYTLLLTLAVFMYGCGGGAGTDSTQKPAPKPVTQSAACAAHEDFFLTQVWPILKNNCFRCHENGKVTSDLTLVGETVTDFNVINFESAKNVSLKKDAQDRSLLLSKPANLNKDHGGGTVLSSNASEYQVLQEMVGRYATCIANTPAATGIVQNTPYQQLRKISLALAGRLPTQNEENRISTAVGDDNALQTAYSDILDQVMSEENFYIRVKEMFNDLLLLDAFPAASAVSRFNLSNFANADYYTVANLDAQNIYTTAERNSIRKMAAYGLTQEPLELIAHVVRNNRPFTEILTANYVLVNPYSATLYNANVDNDPGFNFQYGDAPTLHDPNDFRETIITDNNGRTYPHAGVLTSLSFLTRYPSTNTNINRARSRVVFLYFLDTDVQGLADRAALDLDHVIGDFPTLQDPQCKKCHDIVDPVAGLFKNWQNRGQFRGDFGNWFDKRNPVQMLSPGYTKDIADLLPAENSGNALQWLAQRVVADNRFAVSVVKTVFKGLTGQVLTDNQYLETLKTHFVTGGFNLKALVKEIVNSVYFTAADLGQSENPADFPDVGMAHLLTPEQLHRKILAVTGMAWQSPSKLSLLDRNTYNLLYGGIDSDVVTERTTDPTALMASVQQRIALQTGCQAVPLDFDKTTLDRVMFPLVEITDTPDSALGSDKIKQNIQYLHKQLLGEELAGNDSQIEKDFNLFVAVRGLTPDGEIPVDCRGGLAAGNSVRLDADKTVQPWMAVVSHMLADYRFFYD